MGFFFIARNQFVDLLRMVPKKKKNKKGISREQRLCCEVNSLLSSLLEGK